MRALLDLLFPATCAGCGRADDVVCQECMRLFHAPARPRLPTPSPPLLPTPYAVADYADEVRAVVLRYKEHEQVTLTRPLAHALAISVVAAAAATRHATHTAPGVVIVPVPSSRSARRRRGFDPVLRLAGTVAASLRAAGLPADVVHVLRHVRSVRDSAGLSSGERAQNLDGAFAARPDAGRLLAGRSLVLVDDIVTTGATLAEAARALRAEGVTATASAVVAATVRSTGLIQKGLHNRR